MLIPAGFGLGRLRWTLAGDAEEMISTIGLEFGPGVDVEGAAEGLYDAWLEAFPASQLSDQYTFVGTSVTAGPQPGDGPTAEHVDPVQGTNAQAHPSSNVALLVKKSTALGGRRNRGRMFLPAGYCAEGNIDERGLLASALVSALQTRLNTFYDEITGGIFPDGFVILHGSAPATPTPITGLQLQGLAATQRRRMRR